MPDQRAAQRYARALFELAEEKDLVETAHRELTEALESLKRYPEISHLLGNATVSREEKEDFIQKVLPSSFSATVVHFLKLLVRKGRFQDLPLVWEKFRRLYEEKEGTQRVKVESPLPLSSHLEDRLIKALQKKLGKKIQLETSVNPGLLGGLVLDFDGTRIDGSFQKSLQELRERLLAPLC